MTVNYTTRTYDLDQLLAHTGRRTLRALNAKQAIDLGDGLQWTIGHMVYDLRGFMPGDQATVAL